MSKQKPIAFYGTLMTGGLAQQRLGIEDQLNSLGTCRMRGHLFDLGAYPGLVEPQTTDGIVHGELFELQGSTLLEQLDRFEGYDVKDPAGSFYVRQSVRLIEPDVEAWLYVYRGELAHARKVEDGRWSLPSTTPFERVSVGQCGCGQIRFRLNDRPLFVHACHCRFCQRETGSAFAVNALIESDQLEVLDGEPEAVETPTQSANCQTIFRCPSCCVALFSHYSGSGKAISFVRVGTLELPDRWPPDIHLFTESKQPWVRLPADVPAVPAYYELDQHWPKASLARRRLALVDLR